MNIYCTECGHRHELKYGEKIKECEACHKAIADIVTPERIVKTIQTQPAVKSPTKDKTRPQYTSVIAEDEDADLPDEVPQLDEISLAAELPSKRGVKLGAIIGTNVGGEVVKRPKGQLKTKKALLKEQAELFKPAKSEEIA